MSKTSNFRSHPVSCVSPRRYGMEPLGHLHRPTGKAQTLTGVQGDRTRITLGFQVKPEAVQASLPSPWRLHPLDSGPLKGANLLVVFVDRLRDDDPEGKPRSSATKTNRIIPCSPRPSNPRRADSVPGPRRVCLQPCPGTRLLQGLPCGYRAGGAHDQESGREGRGGDRHLGGPGHDGHRRDRVPAAFPAAGRRADAEQRRAEYHRSAGPSPVADLQVRCRDGCGEERAGGDRPGSGVYLPSHRTEVLASSSMARSNSSGSA